MKTSGSVTPCSRRAASTCRAMMSRKLSPSRTSSSDFARSRPIEVPSPPFSLTTTVPARPSVGVCSGRSTSASAGMSTGSIDDSGIIPVSPLSTSR